MSFSPLLKRLFSLVLFLLAAVKHKRFASDLIWVVFAQPRKQIGILSADPLSQTQRFNRRFVYRCSHDLALIALIIRNRCSCRRIERSIDWAKVIPVLL